MYRLSMVTGRSTWTAPDRRSMVAAFFVAGGVLWVVHALSLATRPRGCVAEGCDVGPAARQTEDISWLLLIFVVLVAVATTVLGRRGSYSGLRWVRAGAGLCIAGVVALAIGIVINVALVGDSPLWWLHDSDSLGQFLPVGGALVAGVGVWRGRLLRPWAGLLLILGALVSLGFNAQNERVLLVVPLGLAWAALGYATLVSTRDIERVDTARH